MLPNENDEYISIRIGTSTVSVFCSASKKSIQEPLSSCDSVRHFLMKEESYLLRAFSYVIGRDSSLAFDNFLLWAFADHDDHGRSINPQIEFEPDGTLSVVVPSLRSESDLHSTVAASFLSDLVGWRHGFLRGDVSVSMALAAIDAANGRLDDAWRRIYVYYANEPNWPLVLDALAAVQAVMAGHQLNPLLERFVGRNIGALARCICPVPFGPALSANGTLFLCKPHWQPRSVGTVGADGGLEDLNSSRACDIRRSVTEGSFRYCILSRCEHAMHGRLVDRQHMPDHIAQAVDHGWRISLPERHSLPGKAEVLDAPHWKSRFPEEKIEIQDKLASDLSRRQNAKHYYFIDVAGSCNLKCPSCAVGNMAVKKTKGLMKLSVFEAVLNKIQSEQTAIGNESVFIDLYNWGEPTLHPDLPEIVRMIRSRGIGCGISSNLNISKNIRNIIKSNPSYFRISVSGFYNESYKVTHRGGDINSVKSNMYAIRKLIDEYNSDIIVQVGYHVYQHNSQKEFDMMADLCFELGFLFAPVVAALMPAEKLVNIIDSASTGGDNEIINKMIFHPFEYPDAYMSRRHEFVECEYKRSRTTINFDGSVALCCATYEDEQIVAKDFLETSFEDIAKRKISNSFCKKCSDNNIDMLYTGVQTFTLANLLAKKIGYKF